MQEIVMQAKVNRTVKDKNYNLFEIFVLLLSMEYISRISAFTKHDS